MKNVIKAFFIIFITLSACIDVKTETKNEESSKPNVIIIYLDDLGYGDLSSYGATELNTPNIEMYLLMKA